MLARRLGWGLAVVVGVALGLAAFANAQDKPRERAREKDQPRAAAKETPPKEGERRDAPAKETPRREGERRDGERRDAPRGEFAERMQMLRKKLHEAQEAGNEGEVKEIRQAIEKMEQRMREFAKPEGSPDRERMQRRFEEVRQQIQKLMQEGKTEEAEALKRRIGEEMRQRMSQGHPEGGPPHQGPGGPMDEQQRRRMYIMAAIQNLRAAGMNDLAEKLQREVGSPGDQGPGAKPGAPMPGAGYHRPMQGPDPAVQQLREQVERMQRDMQELREHMKKQAEKK